VTADRTEKVRAFLEEIEAVCRKHGLSIGHEDHQGAFIVEPLEERNLVWLSNAFEDIDGGTR
jgi:hypothetical protein